MTRCASLLAAGALLLLAACGDHGPTGGVPAPTPAPDALAALRCSVRVDAGSMTCAEAAPSTGGGSATVLGGQGINVRLRNTGNAVQGDTFRMDVTVENLVPQALGTVDGMTPDAGGVRVFFAAGPASSEGDVEVINGGLGFFTAPSQPFFQYDGILAPGDTSAAVEWRFRMGPGVQTFQFTVYVSARVARETGWVRVVPMAPSIAVGELLVLSSTVMTSTGTAVSAPVTWSSSAPAVATVDSAGLVRGNGVGAVTITASSGGRTGSVEVLVRGASGDAVPPILHTLSFSPGRIRAGTDSVTALLQVTDPGSGVEYAQIRFRSPSAGQTRYCGTFYAVSGSPTLYRCKVAVPRYSEGGMWQVESVMVTDEQSNSRTTAYSQLRPAGGQHWLWVDSPDGDAQAPVLTNVAFTPAVATAGVDSIRVSLWLTDVGRGVDFVTARFGATMGSQTTECTTWTSATGSGNAGEFRCKAPLRRTSPGGTWRLLSVYTEDDIGNRRQYDRFALEASGYPTTLTVVSPDADATQPTLTSLSFAPTSVRADGRDSVTAHLGAADTGTGLQEARITFESPTGAHRAECTAFRLASGTDYNGVLRCRLAIPSGSETGAWRVVAVSVRDRAGNYRTVWRAELEAAGYAVGLDVAG